MLVERGRTCVRSGSGDRKKSAFVGDLFVLVDVFGVRGLNGLLGEGGTGICPSAAGSTVSMSCRAYAARESGFG